MPKGYVIVTEAVKDPDGMRAYGRAAGPTIAQGGASVLAADPNPEVLEGEWHGNQTVVLEFESVEAARAWYESPAYQEILPLRTNNAEGTAVLVDGVDPDHRATDALAA